MRRREVRPMTVRARRLRHGTYFSQPRATGAASAEQRELGVTKPSACRRCREGDLVTQRDRTIRRERTAIGTHEGGATQDGAERPECTVRTEIRTPHGQPSPARRVRSAGRQLGTARAIALRMFQFVHILLSRTSLLLTPELCCLNVDWGRRQRINACTHTRM